VIEKSALKPTTTGRSDRKELRSVMAVAGLLSDLRPSLIGRPRNKRREMRLDAPAGRSAFKLLGTGLGHQPLGQFQNSCIG
jgi:hypothetical protein